MVDETDVASSIESPVVNKAKGRSGKNKKIAKTHKARKKIQRSNNSGDGARPFPASSFEDAVDYASKLYSLASGQPVKRLTLFDSLGKSPDSGASRMMTTTANRYGLTKGSYTAESVSLTEDGLKAVGESVDPGERLAVRFKLAIDNIAPFKLLYEAFNGHRLPATQVLVDKVKEADVPEKYAAEGVDIFIVNLRFLGMLRTLSGAERIVSLAHALDEQPDRTTVQVQEREESRARVESKDTSDFETICFYITPIGAEDSAERRHSNLFLGSLVEPALAPLGLKVVRADTIDKPGLITGHIVEYILKSRLVIADLSFHNPNVFYELALRHAARLPIVQIIRKGDKVPFDIQQVRTIVIDDTDIYTLIPKIESYRAEIATHVRSALEAGAEADNPISAYFPSFRVTVGQGTPLKL